MSSEKVTIWLKLLITIMFVAGALIFLYPFVANIVNTQVDKSRIESFQQQLELDEAKQLVKKKQREEKLKENPHLGMKLEDELFNEVEQSSHLSSKEITDHLIGSISIPKINSQLPIFDETTSSFLQEGITLLPGSSYPAGGKNTHSVLTGHTGLAKKKLFTDLKDVVKGDKIYLRVLGETLGYEVDQIKVVLPDNLDDLKIFDGKDYLTLVTCTPYMINTHRLLVRGHRIDINEKELVNEEKKIDKENKKWLLFYLFLISLLVFLFCSVAYRQLKNYKIMRRRYNLRFTLLLNGEIINGLTFKLMDSSKLNNIKRKGKSIKKRTNKDGEFYLKKLKGNHYWLIEKKNGEMPILIKCWVPHIRSKQFKVKLAKNHKPGLSIKLDGEKKE